MTAFHVDAPPLIASSITRCPGAFVSSFRVHRLDIENALRSTSVEVSRTSSLQAVRAMRHYMHFRQIGADQIATVVHLRRVPLRTIAVELLLPFHHIGVASVFFY